VKIFHAGFDIYLESIAIDDAESLALEANSREIAESIAAVGSFPSPYLIENAVSFIQNAMKAALEGREFHFAIKSMADKSLVGVCGITNVDNVSMKAEIGYWVGKTHWGNGYGKQAASLLLEIAFEKLGLNRVYATVLSFNERSIKLLQSVGFVKEGVLRDSTKAALTASAAFTDDLMFGLLRKDYKPLGAKFDM